MKEPIDFDTPIDRSGTYSVKYDEREAKFGRDDCLPLWVADMDLPAPRCVTDALIKRASHPIYGYTVYPDRFYESIVAWMKKRHGWHIGKEAVVPVPGVVPALDFLVTALTPPDGKILIQPPVYHPFFRLSSHHGRTLLTNPLRLEGNSYTIDFEDFSAKAKEADLFILCSPHNPVGRVWREDELERLASICLEEECLLISDEIHADIVHAPNRHIPIASLSARIAHNTVTLNAPSKTFNIAGLNTAYAVVENDSIRRKLLSALRRYDLTMGNLFGIEALMAAYEGGERWLDALLAYLGENIDFITRYLHENIPQIRAVKPEATFLLWLDCRNLGMDDERLRHFFVHEAGLGLNPGTDFGQEGSGFMRMNVGCPRETLEEAMQRLKRAVETIERIERNG
jgi:cystathionine beta-lyase